MVMTIDELKDILKEEYEWDKEWFDYLDHGYFKIDFNDSISVRILERIRDWRIVKKIIK